jgi:Fe-S cluster assembly ATP-binding protein
MLIISSLKAGTDSRTILNGIDLSIADHGEIHVLIGPNGSGKSTLSSVIMGMPGYRVTDGTITFEGVNLLELRTWQIARLGIFVAPQQSTAIPGVILQDALDAAIESPTDVSPKLVTLIEAEASKLKFDTSMLHRSLNADLSGGEQKRSEIIQLAILKPKLAILDEIDSGLDIDGLRAITKRIREIVEEYGTSILLVTHRTRILDELPIDKVHIMVDGRIVESGNIDLAEEIGSNGFAKYQAAAVT